VAADLIAMAEGLRREHVGKCPLSYDPDEWWRENGGPSGHECARWCGAVAHNARVDDLVAELRAALVPSDVVVAPDPLATATTVIHTDDGDGPWVSLARLAVPRGVPGQRARIVVTTEEE